MTIPVFVRLVIHAVDLSAHVLTALVARNGVDPALVDDVIWG